MPRRALAIACGLALLATAPACTLIDPKLEAPSRSKLARLAGAPPPPAGRSWPLPPQRLERLLERGAFEIVSMERTVGGNTGAQKTELRFPAENLTLTVKWKKAPPEDADEYNNAPRKELAAYAIQRWFLDPEHYVVPTVAVRCLPLETLRRFDPEAEPTLPGGACVVGTLSAWLQDVHVPEGFDDPERFASDPNYAFHLANFDVLTKLIDHDDAKPDNFLASNDTANQRFFAIDNGISFGDLRHNYIAVNWDGLRVPALPRASVERLREVGPEQLAALAVLVELEQDRSGMLRPVEPGPPLDPELGARTAPGRLQLGLARAEIEGVAERLSEILEDVETGEVEVF